MPANRQDSVATSYGSSITLSDALRVAKESVERPEFNKNFIQSTARTKGPGGEVDVRNFHESLFSERNAELQTKCLHMEGQAAAELDGIHRQIDEISTIQEKTKRYQELTEDNIPWTPTDRIEMAGLGAFSGISLWVETNNVAQVLHASGIPGFESILRCYLFSMIPVGLAFLFKCLGKLFSNPKHKTAYLSVIWICGLVCGIFWVALFAQTFPGFSQSVAEIINSLSVAHEPNAGSPDGKWLIFFSIFTEALLAAGCWLTMERIAARHEPPRRTDNPAYAKTQGDLNRWIKRKYEQEELRSQIQGKIRRIEDAKRCFGDEAVGYFHLALTAVAHTREINALFKS